MEKKEFGIEKIKEGLASLIGVATEVDDAFEDKKVSIFEGFNIARKSLGLWETIREAPEIWKEVKDLTQEEKEEIISYFEDEFDLKNDMIEMIVEKTLAVAFDIAMMFISLKEAKEAA